MHVHNVKNCMTVKLVDSWFVRSCVLFPVYHIFTRLATGRYGYDI